jgi:hypothetical protein
MNENPEKQQEQEVDLVPVFAWIGTGIKNLFKGLGNILKAIIHFFILFLIFVKNNIILIGTLAILGGVLGFYLSKESKNNFTAQLRVQPNFESAGQLISNLKFYNSLVEQKDFVTLSKQLNITAEQAENLLGFSIKEDFNDTELLREYDQLARQSDSIALENFTFSGYKNAKRLIDYEFYNVEISSKSRLPLEIVATKAIEVKDNPAIKALRMSSIESVVFNIEEMQYQLQEIDSLIRAYQNAIKEVNSNGKNDGTNVFVTNDQNKVSFKEFFMEKATLLSSLEYQRKRKYSFENTVNIVSYFVKSGTIEKKHYVVKFTLVFFGLGLLIALIPLVWRFLNNYQETTVKN